MSDRSVSIVEWSAIVAIIAIDAIFAAATGIGIRRVGAYTELFGIIFALWPAIAVLTRVTGFAKGGAFLAEAVAKTLIFIYVATVLEYDLATSPAPLYDDVLIRADRALGFDWPAVFAWFASHPAVCRIIGFAYFSLAKEAMLVLLVTALFYPTRARQVPTALILSSLMTIPALWIFPVAGAFVVFDHGSLPQASFTADYLGMRAHTMAQIPLDDPRGMISFPSFHASSAVLLTYLVRGIPVLYPAAFLFNGLMVLGTPFFGGHYLVDVLAGLAVAGITIVILERVDLGKELRRLAVFPRVGRPPVEDPR
jgi:hypothetical protein